MWIKLGTIVVVALILAFMVTQVIYPAFTGTKFFWIFRDTGEKRFAKASGNLKDAKANLRASDLEKKEKELRKKAK
jgi:hypothetical protein